MLSVWEKLNVKPTDVFYSKEYGTAFSFVEKENKLFVSCNYKENTFVLPVDNDVLPKYFVPLAEMRVDEELKKNACEMELSKLAEKYLAAKKEA